MQELIYRCDCLPREITLEVRKREEDEDIQVWMEQVVIPAVATMHKRISPYCERKTLTYLKIKVDAQAEGIGM